MYRATDVKKRVKPWIATAIAFAFALQTLLTGVLAAQAAAPAPDARLFGIICLAHSGPDENGKTGHEQHECCVLCQSGTGLADVPRIASTITLLLFSGIRYGAVPLAPFVAAHPTPRLSQGPPRHV